MPPQLLALHEGPSILLDKPILLVGRHQECDIQLPSRKISRRHCCIAQVKDHLVVRDLSSTNGIRINGVRVLEGCLRPGDELAIGNFRYQLRWEGQAGPPARDGKNRSVAPPTAARPEALESCELPVALNEASELAQEPPAGLPIGLPPTAFTADKRARPPLPPLLQPGPADSDVQPSG